MVYAQTCVLPISNQKVSAHATGSKELGVAIVGMWYIKVLVKLHVVKTVLKTTKCYKC